MTQNEILSICSLTNKFYQTHAQSFSNTRNHPWKGWSRLKDIIEPHMAVSNSPYRVCDVAAGNLRFEEFLLSTFPQQTFEFYTYDICEELLHAPSSYAHKLTVHYTQTDIIQAVLNKGSYAFESPQTALCDLTCSFGFLHHVPTFALRFEVLIALIHTTKIGGLVCVSLWEFMKKESLKQKAEINTPQALKLLEQEYPGMSQKLEEHDWFLGWQDSTEAFRYCHHFTQNEINRLVETLRPHATLVEAFTSDGKQNNLNCYLVFKRTA